MSPVDKQCRYLRIEGRKVKGLARSLIPSRVQAAKEKAKNPIYMRRFLSRSQRIGNALTELITKRNQMTPLPRD